MRTSNPYFDLFIFGFFCVILSCFSCSDKKQTGLNYFSAADSLRMNFKERTGEEFSVFIQEIKDLQKQTNDSLSYYELEALLAHILFYSSQYDKVDQIIPVILNYCNLQVENERINLLLFSVYKTQGNTYIRRVMPEQAITSFRKAYGILLKCANRSDMPEICVFLADAYNYAGKFDLATYYYRQALMEAGALDLPEQECAYIYYGLGHTYLQLRNFDLSDHYYQEAGRFFESMSPNEKYIYLNNRGNHYYFKKEYQTALQYFQQASELAYSQPDMVYEQTITNTNLGEIYLLLGKYDSSRYMLQKAYPFFKESGNETGLYYIETLLIGNEIRAKNFSLAEKMILDSYQPTYVSPDILNIRQSYLKEYYEHIGNYKDALAIIKQETRLEDSIRNERIIMNVAEIEFRYQQDTTLMKQTILINDQNNKLKTFRISSYAAIAVLILLFLFILMWVRYTKKRKEMENISHQFQVVNLRMENVRNRIFPHFIFNLLSHVIHSPEDNHKRIHKLEGLVKLLRKNIELVDKQYISLKEELSFVCNYLEMEKDILGSDFIFELNKGDMNIENIYLPSMLLQIPVENAIKHALKSKEGEKRLSILIVKEENATKICIDDNGAGYNVKSGTGEGGTKVGLKVLRQTIHLLNEYNHHKIDFRIYNLKKDSQVKGCRVEFIIPDQYRYL